MNLDLFDVSHCLAATEHLNPDLLDVSRCLAATKHLIALIISIGVYALSSVNAVLRSSVGVARFVYDCRLQIVNAETLVAVRVSGIL